MVTDVVMQQNNHAWDVVHADDPAVDEPIVEPVANTTDEPTAIAHVDDHVGEHVDVTACVVESIDPPATDPHICMLNPNKCSRMIKSKGTTRQCMRNIKSGGLCSAHGG